MFVAYDSYSCLLNFWPSAKDRGPAHKTQGNASRGAAECLNEPVKAISNMTKLMKVLTLTILLATSGHVTVLSWLSDKPSLCVVKWRMSAAARMSLTA